MTRRFTRKLRNLLVTLGLVGASVFTMAPTDGCQEMENAFMQGFEIGYEATSGQAFSGFNGFNGFYY